MGVAALSCDFATLPHYEFRSHKVKSRKRFERVGLSKVSPPIFRDFRSNFEQEQNKIHIYRTSHPINYTGSCSTTNFINPLNIHSGTISQKQSTKTAVKHIHKDKS